MGLTSRRKASLQKAFRICSRPSRRKGIKEKQDGSESSEDRKSKTNCVARYLLGNIRTIDFWEIVHVGSHSFVRSIDWLVWFCAWLAIFGCLFVRSIDWLIESLLTDWRIDRLIDLIGFSSHRLQVHWCTVFCRHHSHESRKFSFLHGLFFLIILILLLHITGSGSGARFLREGRGDRHQNIQPWSHRASYFVRGLSVAHLFWFFIANFLLYLCVSACGFSKRRQGSDQRYFRTVWSSHRVDRGAWPRTEWCGSPKRRGKRLILAYFDDLISALMYFL